MPRGLVILDRDGVLNRHLVDPEQGTIDSPLHPSQVVIIPGIAEALARIQALGYGLAIATNQPAAAKGKTTLDNLHDVQAVVVAAAQSAGARILSSHLCLHRQEDSCSCRKPKAGLLEQALAANPGYDRRLSWMIGDGVTDVEAGRAAGLHTGFLGKKRCDSCRILEASPPDVWLESLGELAVVLGR